MLILLGILSFKLATGLGLKGYYKKSANCGKDGQVDGFTWGTLQKDTCYNTPLDVVFVPHGYTCETLICVTGHTSLRYSGLGTVLAPWITGPAFPAISAEHVQEKCEVLQDHMYLAQCY